MPHPVEWAARATQITAHCCRSCAGKTHHVPAFPGLRPGEPYSGIVDQRDGAATRGGGGSEGYRRAFSSVSASEYERGTAFGWYHLTVGLNAIPAGALSGALVLLANQQESR